MSALTALVIATLALSASSPGSGATARATGTLDLRAELSLTSRLVDCPAGVTASACATRTGKGLVPGLGSVTYSYTWLTDLGAPTCATDERRTRAYDVVLAVAGKGELRLGLSGGSRCVSIDDVREQSQAFVVKGGTGVYVGASGSGTVGRALGEPTFSGARLGREIWSGTLAVPTIEFDLTPPALTGVAARAVRTSRRATRARVMYAVTARDEVDADVPVACSPRSGTRFRVGRTVVTCSAADTSGNARTATFTVTVRRR